MSERLNNYKNQLFYLAYFIMILNSSLMRNINSKISKILIVVYIILFILNITMKRYKIKEFIFIHIMIALGGIVFIKSYELQILILIILILSSSEIKIDKVIKIDFFTRLIGVILTILLCAVGVTKDFTMYRYDIAGNIIDIRHSLGFIHPNTLSIQIFMLIMSYVYLRYKYIKLNEYIILFFTMHIFTEITDSRTPMICTAIALIFLLIFKKFKIINKNIVRNIIIYIVPICTIISFLLIYLYKYDMQIVNIVNKLLSGRIKSANYFLETYGISLLGQNIKLVSILDYQSTSEQMRILDNLYASLSIRSGMIFLILYNILYVKLNKYLINNSYIYECIIITVISLYGLVEKAPINSELNFTLILLGLVIFRRKLNYNIDIK